jgi:PAS domain S-box-containing protein
MKAIVQQRNSGSAVRMLLLLCCALPLAYVITGRLGLLLATSPGYATAVFLPAGIAVAAAFISGPASLPGTFLGSLLLNLWIGYSLSHELELTKIVTAAAIAFASALQAGIGGIVLRRAIGYPAPFDNSRDVLLFLLLSPLVCLTSATVSISMMWLLGVVQSADLAINWMTWWVGDTLGVVVALPLILVLAGQPRALWELRFWYVAIPMALCFALFVAVFIRVKSWEETQSLAEFRIRSQQLADSVKAALEEQNLFLDQLSQAFINRKAAVDRQEFDGLARALLQRFPTIQAVEWAPRITADEREAFEAAQRAEMPEFEIRERSASGDMRSAGAHPEFYPVTYIEPLAGNEAAAGFDLASDPSRQAAIEDATRGGGVIATAPIRLVQERGEQAGLLLLHSVSAGPNGPGIVLVVLRMGSFAATLLSPLQSTLGLRLVDISSSQPLFDNLDTTSPAYQTTLDFGARRYLIQTAPSAEYLANHRGWQSWMVLAGGVLGTGLLGALLMLGTGHAYRLRAKEEELEAIINRTPFMLTRCSHDLRYRFVSRSYAKMLGRRPEEIAGRPIVEIMGEEGFKTIFPHVQKALQGERTEYEEAVHFQGVGERVLRVVYTPDQTDQGNTEGWIASILDITDQKRAESQRDSLIAEVNHRVKNTLATVIAIAHQSFGRQQPFELPLRSFGDRIRALAQTHTRLAEANWSGVALRSVVEDETGPYRTDGNVGISGPDITLTPKCALSLGMAIHELATNAAKYGALSSKGGSIKISWEVLPPRNEVRLNWIESGGPTVRPPQRSGFGRRLLEKALASDLNGTVKLDFRQEGLTCLITFPLDRQTVAASAGADDRFGDFANESAPAQKGPARIANCDLPTGARVLVVEDEFLLALEVEEALHSVGFRVIGPFCDLAKATQAARCEAIDVAILDMNLNGQMVYPLAVELEARGVPFLFITGYDASNLPERFRTVPRVAKPFDHADLINQVQAAIIGPQQRAAVRASL